MSDVQGLNAQTFTPQQVPQQTASLGEAFGALAPPITAPTEPAPGAQFVSSPVPAVPPVVNNVAEITNGWHRGDPLKVGMAQGFIANYAKQMPGGLGQAAQHLNTFRNLIDSGQLADTGDDKEAHRLWAKFNSSPERMSSAESAQLAEHLRTVGNATSQSPDLRFDPVGKVGKVGSDGSVRVDYPPVERAADLDLRPLAVTGLNNLRRMAAIGQGASGSASVLDTLPAFLGLNPQERPNAQGHTDLSAALQVVANETGSDVNQVAAQVAAGWDQLAPTDVPWRKPWAMSIDGPNPAAEALDGRLSSKLVAALGQGVSELDFTGGKNLSVTSTAGGGLAVSGKPNIKNGRLLRHLYPAFAKDGTTAWLPGVPAKTADVTRLDGETSVYNGPLMDQAGGHPGLVAGDHVIFDAPPRFTSPIQATSLGSVMSRTPEYVMDRLGPADINEDEFTTPKSVLTTNAWALIPGGNEVKVALTRKGFKPIKHVIGTQTHQLVFGISPDDAQKMTTGEVVTNAGTWGHDGFRPGDGVTFSRPKDGATSITQLFGGDVSWHLSGVDRDAPATSEPGTVRNTQVRAQRQVAHLDPSAVADLSRTLNSLTQAGATIRQVYSHRDAISGYKSVYEHIFTDGQNYASHLSPHPSADGHVVPVFVPHTQHVPDAPEQVPSVRQGTSGMQLNGVSVLTSDKLTKLTDLKQKFLSADGDALIPSDTDGEAQIVGNRLRVKEPSTGAAAVIRLARLAGMSQSDIQGPLPDKMETTDRSKAFTISGANVPELRRTQPNETWSAQHGIEFDPAWRAGDGIQALDPNLQAAMSVIFGRYTEQHGDADKMWGLQRIAMTSAYTDSPAYTEWGKLGGNIGLSVKHYSAPEQLATIQMDYARQGVTALARSAQGLTALAYPLAHELGHTVHGALQFGSDESGAKAELLALRRHLGIDGIRRGLSQQAVASPEEMVAEAVASGLTGNPGPVARDVIKIVTSALAKVQSARGAVNW